MVATIHDVTVAEAVCSPVAYSHWWKLTTPHA
jgi:hypothetical protein